MKIKWLGHACFLLTSESGTRVMTDPFDETVGYALPAVEADIVTSSHDHFDHNHTAVVKGSFVKVDKAGKHNEKGIEITGVQTFHDEQGGAKRGKNVVFKFNIDGIKVCHCGDLGHVLTPDQVKEIGEVDVLLVPVGGVFTVDAQGARQVVEQLKPRLTIPMHFKTPALKFQVDGVDKFLSVMGKGQRLNQKEIEVNKENLANMPEIAVLDY